MYRPQHQLGESWFHYEMTLNVWAGIPLEKPDSISDGRWQAMLRQVARWLGEPPELGVPFEAVSALLCET